MRKQRKLGAPRRRAGKVGGCGQPPKLSRQNDPATLPLCNDAIKDGLEPENGTLKIFNYADYVGPDTIKAFEKQYGVKVEVTMFDSMDDAVSKLQANTANFDITNVSPDRIGSLVATATCSRSTTATSPTSRTSGRRCKTRSTTRARGTRSRTRCTRPAWATASTRSIRPTTRSSSKDGTDLLYNPKYKGRTWVLDDDREALSMALLRLGITDVNTEDPASSTRRARSSAGSSASST